MTLVELLVGLAVFSVVSLAVGAVFVTGLNLSGFFFRNANTMESVSDGISQLSYIMPGIVKVNSCACSGTGGAIADCTWSPSSEWLDPVVNGGVANGSTIFEGEFEAGSGGSGAIGTDETLTSGLTSPRGCGSNPYLAAGRGCRQLVRLVYNAPVIEAGSVRSVPGSLVIEVRSVADPNSATVVTRFRIGNEGATVSRNGLVGMSCGFSSPTAGQVGTNFVINLKTKVKRSNIESTANANYESWHPSGVNYGMGFFREAKLKFSFHNLTVRGAYHWRLQSIRQCKTPQKVGEILSSASSSADQCCSGAKNGTACLGSCRPSGEAATDEQSCCSEKISGGVCI